MVLLAVLQTAIFSRLPLLNGTADLFLLVITAYALQERVTDPWLWAVIGGLVVSFITALPFPTTLVAYLFVTALALLLRRRVWQTPALAMFAIVFIGTLVVQGFSVAVLKIFGTPIDLGDAMNLVILPSLMLNMLLALPVHAMIADLVPWVYPMDLEA